MNDLVIRRWSLSDLEAIRHIAWETWIATYSTFIPKEDLLSYLDENYTIDSLRKLFHTKDVCTFIAEVESKPVGFSKAQLNPDDGKFYVASLYVLPKYQGRGIGGRLLRASEEFGLTFGVHEVWLGVMEHNTSALDWYKKLGFHFVLEAPFTMGTTTVNHLIGFKKIAITTTEDT